MEGGSAEVGVKEVEEEYEEVSMAEYEEAEEGEMG